MKKLMSFLILGAILMTPIAFGEESSPKSKICNRGQGDRAIVQNGKETMIHDGDTMNMDGNMDTEDGTTLNTDKMKRKV